MWHHCWKNIYVIYPNHYYVDHYILPFYQRKVSNVVLIAILGSTLWWRDLLLFLEIRNRRLQLEALSHLIQLLPVAHRDTLYVLLKFLAHVARCSDDVMNLSNNTCISVGNKMDSANLATVIAPNILHSNKDASAIVASEEEAEERLDVINVVRTMIDHYEEIFAVPADVMDDVYTVMMDTFPQQLDYLFDRKQSQDRKE